MVGPSPLDTLPGPKTPWWKTSSRPWPTLHEFLYSNPRQRGSLREYFGVLLPQTRSKLPLWIRELFDLIKDLPLCPGDVSPDSLKVRDRGRSRRRRPTGPRTSGRHPECHVGRDGLRHLWIPSPLMMVPLLMNPSEHNTHLIRRLYDVSPGPGPHFFVV